MILAIETATKVCSVAVWDNSGSIREERTEEYGGHSERLFTFLKKLQHEVGFHIQQLDACLVSEGPGSYTGLRIGASGVKGLLYGREISLFAVNTLAAMAWGVREHVEESGIVHAVIDARRNHLYHQSFQIDNQSISADSDKSIRTLEELNEQIDSVDVVVGTGWDRLDENKIRNANAFGFAHISAVHMIHLYKWMSQRIKTGNVQHGQALLRKVRPADFDPAYVTRKKPGT